MSPFATTAETEIASARPFQNPSHHAISDGMFASGDEDSVDGFRFEANIASRVPEWVCTGDPLRDRSAKRTYAQWHYCVAAA
jgi:hypothetical protein